MKTFKNFKYKESLPLRGRNKHKSWIREYNQPEDTEYRLRTIRKNNIKKNLYDNMKLCISDMYKDMYNLFRHKVKNISPQDFLNDTYLYNNPLNVMGDDYICVLEGGDDEGSDNMFALIISNFKYFRDSKDLFELSPRRTHILLSIGENILTNFDKEDFNPDTLITEIKNNLGISKDLSDLVYDTLVFIDKTKEYNILEGIDSSYSIVDLGSILELENNYDLIKDTIFSVYLMFKNNMVKNR